MTVVNLTSGVVKQLMCEHGFRLLPIVQTLGGNLTLDRESPPVHFLDPGGAGRTITLPAEADSEGLVFVIWNTADALEVLTIEDDAAGAVATPTQNEASVCICDGTAWHGFTVTTES